MPSRRSTLGKKASPHTRVGQLGINLIEKIVLRDLKCLWTPTQAASDVGIDGYIEICRPRGRYEPQIVLREDVERIRY